MNGGPRVAVVSLGCPKNLTDSEVMSGVLGRAGFTLTDDLEAAEAIVVNTCAFIGPARDEAWEVIGRAAALRRRGGCRALVVAGCLAQGFAQEIRRRVPEVDRLLGTGDVQEVARVVADALAGRKSPEPQTGPEGRRLRTPGYLPDKDAPRLVSTPGHYAYLKIAEGCDHRCAFCLIPSLRGPYRSRPPEDVVAEARALDRMGVKELVLVAQDTTAYGRDLRGRPLLGELCRRILAETGVSWLRVLYGYPSTLPDDFVALLGEEAAGRPDALPSGEGRLCRYLDLPMQHASDRILRAMGRRETRQSLRRLVERLRRDVPGVTIRSSFIVGYPGETEEDFQQLLSFLSEVRLERAGFFAYSREEGTKAARLPGQLDDKTKGQRLARAAMWQRRIVREHQRALVGSTLRVLVETIERRPGRAGTESVRGEDVLVRARSEADAPEIDGCVLVRWPEEDGRGAPPAAGEFIRVKVTGYRGYDLLAVPASIPSRTSTPGSTH